MSKTDNLQLEIPSAADKHIFTTYKNNNEIIDEAYGQYLEDQETSQENIAMIESSTAQSNHAIGSYFMLDNVLHKATSAIASGETITSGSNATPITIEEALTALNTSVNSLRDSVNQLFTGAKLNATDLNEVDLGVCRYSPTTANRPSNYGICLTFSFYGEGKTQIALPNKGQGTAMKWRSKTTNAEGWSGWKNVTEPLV